MDKLFLPRFPLFQISAPNRPRYLQLSLPVVPDIERRHINALLLLLLAVRKDVLIAFKFITILITTFFPTYTYYPSLCNGIFGGQKGRTQNSSGYVEAIEKKPCTLNAKAHCYKWTGNRSLPLTSSTFCWASWCFFPLPPGDFANLFQFRKKIRATDWQKGPLI